MTALVWIISVITNFLNPIGMIATCLLLAEGEVDMFILPLIMGGVGVIYGFATFEYGIAPRMFWVKSKVSLFDMRVGAALGYGLQFLNSTVAIIVLTEFL